ncbi:GNAT family N-acetyltransferase [Fictibacillus iocasae]|uniref:GNAT family N-acetyltransferase n=1 Tax=Fictibacillus iocasae TaxID=2715437 RepID=A0ABW2NV72_9BACL
MVHKDGAVLLRPIQEEDLPRLWELAYKEENPEWKKWDAPYFEHKALLFQEYIETHQVVDRDDYWAIVVEGIVVGTVGYYWEHKPSNWLEMGITIYDPAYWSGGDGTRALKMWIRYLFTTMPLVRVGFTTWSGNERMIKAGEKLGMTMEARLRKCRLYNGVYYDSIRMGLLREEWEMRNED